MAVYGEKEHLGFRQDVTDIARRIIWAKDDGLGQNGGVRLVAYCNGVTCELVSDDFGVTYTLDGTNQSDDIFLEEVKNHVDWTKEPKFDEGTSDEKKETNLNYLIGHKPMESPAITDIIGRIMGGPTDEQLDAYKKKYQKVCQDTERDATYRLEFQFQYSGFLSKFRYLTKTLVEDLDEHGPFLRAVKTKSDGRIEHHANQPSRDTSDSLRVFRCCYLQSVQCFFNITDNDLTAKAFTEFNDQNKTRIAQGLDRNLIKNRVFVLEVPPPALVRNYGETLMFDAPYVGILSYRIDSTPIAGLRCSSLGQRSPLIVPVPESPSSVIDETVTELTFSSYELAKMYADDIFGPIIESRGDSWDVCGIRALLDFNSDDKKNKIVAGDIIESVGIIIHNLDPEQPPRTQDLQLMTNWAKLSVLCRYCWAAWINYSPPKELGFETLENVNRVRRSDEPEYDYLAKIGPRLLEHRMSDTGGENFDDFVKSLDEFFKDFWPDKDVEFKFTIQKGSRIKLDTAAQCMSRDGFPGTCAAECVINPLPSDDADFNSTRLRTTVSTGLMKTARWKIAAYADQTTGGGRDFLRTIPPSHAFSSFDASPVTLKPLWGGVPGTFWTRCLSQTQPWTHVSNADIDGLSDVFGDGVGISSLYRQALTSKISAAEKDDTADDCYELVSLSEARFLREPSLTSPMAVISFDGAGCRSWCIEMNSTVASNAIAFAFYLLQEMAQHSGKAIVPR